MSEAGFGDTQVLVVGAGPAGLVAGITLARYGVDVLVIDRRDEIWVLSRALVGIPPSAGRVIMTLDDTAVPTRSVGLR